MSAAIEEHIVSEDGSIADDVFLNAGSFTFQGAPLNTSWRRYNLIQKSGLDCFREGADVVRVDYPGFIDDAAKIVFVCLADNEKIQAWRKDLQAFDRELQDWGDEKRFFPAEPHTMELLAVAGSIFSEWYEGGNVPEDEGPK